MIVLYETKSSRLVFDNGMFHIQKAGKVKSTNDALKALEDWDRIEKEEKRK